MPRLVVLDALGLAYRAYYAMVRWDKDTSSGEKIPRSLLNNSHGEPTNAIFGFANMLQRLRRELHPDYWALAWDGPGPTFRHELFDQYKVTRKPMPEELAAQLSPIEELAQAMGLPVIEKPGMEADDVMATLAYRAAAVGVDVVLVTSDKDMLQVVNDRVTVLAPQGSGEAYLPLDATAVLAKWEVPPTQIRDLLALMGDSSDNIPGVPGVGEVTAKQLLAQFGSLETLYQRLDDVKKPALKKKLEENRAMAYLSRDLATVHHDLDLGLELESLAAAPIRREELLAFAQRWEVRRLESVARDLGVSGSDAGAPVASRDPSRRGTAAEQRGTGVKLRESDARAADAAADAAGVGAPPAAGPQGDLFGAPAIAPPTQPLPAVLSGGPQAALDLWSAGASSPETSSPGGATSLDAIERSLHEVRARSWHGLAIVPVSHGADPRRASLVGLALAARDGTACYVPIAHEQGPNVSLERLREWLGPALADANCAKVAHDLKHDRHVLAAANLPLAGGHFDLHVGSFLCDPARDHSLPALARDVLGVELGALEPAAPRGKPKPGPGALPVAEAAAAAERHAAALFPLAEALRAQLESREQWALYRDLEDPLIDVLWTMERHGIALDPRVLIEMSETSAHEIAALERELYALAGEELNLASGPQLGRVLFEKLGLKATKKTKTGWSTDSEVLEGLATEHDFPKKLLEWRALTKLKSTYLDALPLSADPADGRVHTTFEQTGAATGRLSSFDPNLQNIPMRTPQGRAIRRAFVAAPNNVLVGADYSQIELRVMAHLSGDAALMEAFTTGEDVHASTARRVFKVTGDVPAELRSRAKIVNFGVMYGMGSRSLAQQMGIPLAEAKEFIEDYFRVYSGVRAFLDRTVADARERGFVQTLLGRRRWLPALRSGGGMERAMAERAAINTPIQGTAADLVKLAMIRVQRALDRRGGTARLLLQVHDELVLECPANSAREVAALVQREMEGAHPLNVPLTVSVGTGPTWFDIH